MKNKKKKKKRFKFFNIKLKEENIFKFISKAFFLPFHYEV